MTQRRAKSEIIRDILHEATEASSKTKLSNRVNVNVKLFLPYFKTLQDMNYIETTLDASGKKKLFRTTEKGKALLEKLKEITELFAVMKGKKTSNNSLNHSSSSKAYP